MALGRRGRKGSRRGRTHTPKRGPLSVTSFLVQSEKELRAVLIGLLVVCLVSVPVLLMVIP